MSGNVVPQKGPAMEDVYDNVETTDPIEKQKLSLIDESSDYSTKQDFYKMPNPELKMYVFPHFSGADEVPIPGYETRFSAYDHAHYILSNEIE
jgi:conjugative transfer region lipoprotein (TIGR03751 family)